MSEHYDNRNPDQIQRDIERTRAEMGETLDTIQQKLSPGELLDQAMHYFKHSGPSQFTSNLGETVKENPIPVTLIGVGLAWLMMGGSRRSPAAGNWTTSSPAGSRSGEMAGHAVGRAGQSMQGVRERAGEASARLGETVHGAQEHLSGAAENAYYQTRYQAARARDTFNYLLTEQPLVLGAVGLAIGAALGAGLPPTRYEDEMLGETRDEYVHKAREVGQEQLEKAKHVASAAGQTVREQTSREGVTPESADQRRHEAGDEAHQVTQTTVQIPREEAHKQGLPS